MLLNFWVGVFVRDKLRIVVIDERREFKIGFCIRDCIEFLCFWLVKLDVILIFILGLGGRGLVIKNILLLEGFLLVIMGFVLLFLVIILFRL